MPPDDATLIGLLGELEALAERVGGSAARVVELRARLERRRDAPLRLILGLPATIDLFLARWLGPPVGKAALAAGERPLVIGPAPDTIGPPIGRWPGVRHELPVDGHLVVVRSEGRPRADVLAGLQSLAPFDQALLVTRLGQPFNPDDRMLAACLQTLASRTEVLVMGQGEPEDTGEFPRIAAYVGSRLAAAGLDPEQQGTTAVWCPGFTPSGGTIGHPEDLLTPPAAEIELGRRAAFRHGIADLLDEIEEAAGASAAQPLDENEQAQAIREFGTRWDALSRRLAAMVQNGEIRNDDAARAFLMDTVDTWSTGEGPAAVWLREIERRQPGLASTLVAELRSHLHLVHVRKDSRPAAALSLPKSVQLPPARPVGIAIGIGAIGFMAAWLILQIVFSSWLAAILANLAALGVSLVVFDRVSGEGALGRRGFGGGGADRNLLGVEPLNQHLQAWFGSRIRAAPENVMTTCARLRERLGLPRLESSPSR